MPAGTQEILLCAVGCGFLAASFHFYRAQRTLPFKVRFEKVAIGVRNFFACFSVGVPCEHDSLDASFSLHARFLQVSWALGVPLFGSGIILLVQPPKAEKVRFSGLQLPPDFVSHHLYGCGTMMI
jgi:hypothetical protein